MLGKKLVILDFDGTIGDSQDFIINTMLSTLSTLRLELPSRQACLETIGLPLAECFKEAAHVDDDLAQKCAEVYREIFKLNNKPGTVPPYPGVLDTLNKLRLLGCKITIASSRGHASLKSFVQEYAITNTIDMIVGADDVEHAKPNAEPVLKILSRYPVRKSETLMVGDTIFDIQMGIAAGVSTCGVTYGNGTRDELINAGADYTIDSFSKLIEIVKEQK